jgi:hypothetical protein
MTTSLPDRATGTQPDPHETSPLFLLFLSFADDAPGRASADRMVRAVGAVHRDSAEAGRVCVRLGV